MIVNDGAATNIDAKLVRDCGAMRNRMKNLVWAKRGNEEGDEGASSSPIASDNEEGTEEESCPPKWVAALPSSPMRRCVYGHDPCSIRTCGE